MVVLSSSYDDIHSQCMMITIRWRAAAAMFTDTFPCHLCIFKLHSAYKLASPRNQGVGGAHFPNDDTSYPIPKASRTYRSAMRYL